MSIQIIGTLKCRETKKCRLWFDQRKLAYHFVDLARRPLSERELDSIAQCTGWENLLDKKGRVWKDRQLAWKDFDPRQELLETPLLMVTPVVRRGKTAVWGWEPSAWQQLVKESS